MFRVLGRLTPDHVLTRKVWLPIGVTGVVVAHRATVLRRQTVMDEIPANIDTLAVV